MEMLTLLSPPVLNGPPHSLFNIYDISHHWYQHISKQCGRASTILWLWKLQIKDIFQTGLWWWTLSQNENRASVMVLLFKFFFCWLDVPLTLEGQTSNCIASLRHLTNYMIITTIWARVHLYWSQFFGKCIAHGLWPWLAASAVSSPLLEPSFLFFSTNRQNQACRKPRYLRLLWDWD